MKKLKVVLIGAGNRGTCYSDIMHDMMPDKYEVIAVAEPILSRREYIKEKHNLPENMCFADWQDLLTLGKIGDVAVIATMDREHYKPAIKAIQLKYHLLLEKPVAQDPKTCFEITRCAEENDVKVVVCTVLRYTEVFMKLKELIDSGVIGRVMSIHYEEGVGYVHQTHSFVRGNWGNSQRSSTMLVQKSCHDLDILQWLIGKKLKKVQSFGMLSYFREENAPEGAPDYCIQGCPHADTCPYNAIKVYLDDKENAWFRTTCARECDPTDEMIEAAITNTQYGKCVYKCDNDVVDHQITNLLFEDDILVDFNMSAFNDGGRVMHVMGTKGELRVDAENGKYIEWYDLLTGKTTEIPVSTGQGILTGHGGGDAGIVRDLYLYLNGTYTGKSIPEIRETYYNHMITFAAEKAREEGVVVDFDEYMQSF